MIKSKNQLSTTSHYSMRCEYQFYYKFHKITYIYEWTLANREKQNLVWCRLTILLQISERYDCHTQVFGANLDLIIKQTLLITKHVAVM